MNQCTTQSQLLLHSSRQCTCPTLLEGGNLFINGAYPLVVFFNGRMKYGGKETQVFFYREVLIQREAPRHVTYALPYRTEVDPYIRIQYPGTSLVR